jgi:hypothetical protein
MTGSLRQTPGTFYVDLVLPLLCLQLLTLGKGGRGIGHWPGVLFCSDYFLGWRIGEARRILNSGGLRLEDVASGYWTLPFKQSSGLVSHRSLGFARDFGSRLRRRESASSSSPSSSARPSTLCTCQSSCGECYNSHVSQVAYQLATLRAPDDYRGF